MQGLVDIASSSATRDQILDKYLDICVNYYNQQPVTCDGLAERNLVRNALFNFKM